MAVCKEYAADIVRNFDKDDELRDITLVAGIDGQRFPVHRIILSVSSEYFRDLFRTRLKDNEIIIKDIGGPMLKVIIDFCYTGRIELTEENVDDILAAASTLELSRLEQKCYKFWEMNFSENNLVFTLMRADKFDLENLRERTMDTICREFENVPVAELQQLDEHLFREILSSCRIAAREIVIFDRITHWVDENEIDRAKYVANFLKHIKLEQIPLEILREKVDPFCRKYGCTELLLDEYRNRTTVQSVAVDHQAIVTKTVDTVSPRVVVRIPHMVATRPQNSAISSTGQPGSRLLLKTENGQYRLLHVGPAQGQPAQPSIPNSGANQTIPIQTLPSSMQTVTSSSANTVIVNSSHTTSMMNSATTSQLPPIASVAPVTHAMVVQHQQQHQQQQQQQAPQSQIHHQAIVTSAPQPNIQANAAPANQASVHNIKEKCREFLANLLKVSSREPKQVAQNVCALIQELIDATIEPPEFCNRLECLLKITTQPCLIGFLKKSLPLLRKSLFTKELSIEGVKPPPHSVAFGAASPRTIQARVRPVFPTLPTIGGSRMMAQPRPTLITRHSVLVRSQGPITVPRLANPFVYQIPMQSDAEFIQQDPDNVQLQSNPPALHPVSQNDFSAPGGSQILCEKVDPNTI